MYISIYFHVYLYLYLLRFYFDNSISYTSSLKLFRPMGSENFNHVIYIVQSQGYKCARKTGTNKLCVQSARFLALIWHKTRPSTRWR